MNNYRRKELLRDTRNLAATFIHRETALGADGYLEEFSDLKEREFVRAELQRIMDNLWTSAERINPDKDTVK
jgi:hypothetical protein